MKSVYIFRGAPATGKGTVVPEFCKLLPGPVAHIDQDVFRWNFHLIGRTVADVSEAEHALAYQNMLLVYEQYLRSSSYEVVVEGLFTWDDTSSSQGSAKHLAALAEQYGCSVKSIVLTADKQQMLERNARRGYSVPAAEFELLYSGVYQTVDSSEIVVDSTDQTPRETLAVLKRFI